MQLRVPWDVSYDVIRTVRKTRSALLNASSIGQRRRLYSLFPYEVVFQGQKQENRKRDSKGVNVALKWTSFQLAGLVLRRT